MKKIIKYKKLVSVFVCFSILLSSILFIDVDAAKRIKSTKIALITGKATISIGDIIDLDAKMTPANTTDKYKWYTSNSKIATVNNYGVVTGIKTGKSTITVKTTSGKTAKCVVTVKKYLSESEIVKLIKLNTLSKQDIITLIKDNTLSNESVIELIKSNTLSETDVNGLIDKKILSEDDIKTLIKENTLTEAQVRSIAASYSTSSSQIKAIVKDYIDNNVNNESDDWKDGTELKLYEKQRLPMIINSTYNTNNLEVTSISVKKYHFNDYTENTYYKYKYLVSFNGILQENIPSTKNLAIIIFLSGKYITSEGCPCIYFNKQNVIEEAPDSIKISKTNHIFYSDTDFNTFGFKYNTLMEEDLME